MSYVKYPFFHLCKKILYLTTAVTGMVKMGLKGHERKKGEWNSQGMLTGVYIWAVRYEKGHSNVYDTQFPSIPLLLLLNQEVKQSKWGQCISPLQDDCRVQACFSCLVGFLAETCITFKVYLSNVLKLCILALKCTVHQWINSTAGTELYLIPPK